MIFTSDLSLIAEALNTIRSSFEGAQRRGVRVDPELLEVAYLKFESVRFSFVNGYSSFRFERRDTANAEQILHKLWGDLQELLNNDKYVQVTDRLPLTRGLRRPDRPTAPDMDVIFEVNPRATRVAEFTARLRDVVSGGLDLAGELPLEPFVGGGQDAAARLRTIVPAQKVAPAQFEVVDGRLVVKNGVSVPSPDAEKISKAARDEIIRRGAALLSELDNSNCDPRLVDSFKELQNYLCVSENAIQIGLANLNCEALRSAFEKELPDAIGALLQSQTIAVNMLLSQYPDWVTFNDNAQAAKLGEEDARRVFAALIKVADSTEARPEIADPDVPRTVRAISKFVANPHGATKKAILAAIRTLENLVSRVFGYGGEFIEKSIQKTIDSASTTVARVAMVALLTTGVAAGADLGSLASKVEGLGWVKDATSIVRKQLEELSK